MSPLEALVALNSLPRIGPIRITKLLECFGGAPPIFKATKDQLLRIPGIGAETAEIILQWQSHSDPTAELREVAERGMHILTQEDHDYPSSLRQAYDPPVLLYVWGTIEKRDRHAIAVVGSRRSTHYGNQTTKKLSFQLAHAGFTIISGLARGIDTAAHEAALAANGRTIAVIGSGLARLYPPENLGLAEKIASGHGAVISEFPLHTPPDKQTFPMRNRIVASWSQALLVTECPSWSGALITANLAAEYGKTVYAVPGPIDRPSSAGCHQLIREGATLISDAGQILEDFNQLPLGSSPTMQDSVMPPLSEEENAIHSALGLDESSVDQLIERTQLPASLVSRTLMKLEMKGLAKTLPGFRYTRRP